MSTPDFFRNRLDAMIDLRHPLATEHPLPFFNSGMRNSEVDVATRQSSVIENWNPMPIA
jgi:hypothetical protein